jgi:hypothetical protein
VTPHLWRILRMLTLDCMTRDECRKRLKCSTSSLNHNVELILAHYKTRKVIKAALEAGVLQPGPRARE